MWTGTPVAHAVPGLYLGAYGTGNRPEFRGASAVGANWTSIGSNLFTTPLTYSPYVGWVQTGAAYARKEFTKLLPEYRPNSNFLSTESTSTPPANAWGMTWNSGTNLLTIKTDGTDPDALTIYICQSIVSTQNGVSRGSGASNSITADICSRLWSA